MLRLSLGALCLALVAPSIVGKFQIHKVGEPLSQDEVRKGRSGFDCLRELFGEEGEHVLMEDPVDRFGMENKEETLTEQERHETIYRMFGEEGIETMCDITRKLRRARLLTSVETKSTPDQHESPSEHSRRAQACVPAQPLYPSQNDIANAYNDWASEHIDMFLPDGSDRTSRTDPNKLVTDIQDSIDASMEAEYSSMACYPIANGLASIASIPDIVIFQQGSIAHGIKNIVCNFGSRVSNYATASLYKKLDRARFHDISIDGAEQRATYMNTNSMVNQVCASQGTLSRAVEDLADIKRTLETRRA